MIITGEFTDFRVSDVDIDYEGLTEDLERTPNDTPVDRLGYFNFSASGNLGATIKCTERECGKIIREWFMNGDVSVNDVPFKAPYTEPVYPIPGLSALIWAYKVIRTGKYISEAKPYIEEAGKALLNSPDLICRDQSFLKK